MQNASLVCIHPVSDTVLFVVIKNHLRGKKQVRLMRNPVPEYKITTQPRQMGYKNYLAEIADLIEDEITDLADEELMPQLDEHALDFLLNTQHEMKMLELLKELSQISGVSLCSTLLDLYRSLGEDPDLWKY